MKRFERITPEGTKDAFLKSAGTKGDYDLLAHCILNSGFHQVVTPGFNLRYFSSAEMYYPQETMYKSVDNKGRCWWRAGLYYPYSSFGLHQIEGLSHAPEALLRAKVVQE